MRWMCMLLFLSEGEGVRKREEMQIYLLESEKRYETTRLQVYFWESKKVKWNF